MNQIEEPQPDNYVSFNEVSPLPPNKRDFLPAIINPDTPHWNVWSALGYVLISLLAIIIFPNVALIIYAVANSIPVAEWKDLVDDPKVILVAVITTLPAHLLTILAGWALVTRAGKTPFFETLGWEWKKIGFWKCLLTTIAFYAIAAWFINRYFADQENELTRILSSSRAAVYAIAFIATFTAPLVEEVVYRGVLYPAFRAKLGAPIAVIIVTLVFSLIHVPQYLPNYGTIIVITALSLMLTLVRAQTKSLLPCVTIHTIFNGITSILLLAQPFLPKTFAPDEPSAGAIPHLLFFLNSIG